VSQKHVYQPIITDSKAAPVNMEEVATITVNVTRQQMIGVSIGDTVQLTGNDKPEDFLVERIDYGETSDHATLHLRSMQSAAKEKPELIEIHEEYPEVEEAALDINHELRQ